MDTLTRLRTGQLAGATRLDLSCGLTELPPEVFDLADTLEVLNLSGNRLRALPRDLHRLHKLRVLFCSDNDFTTVPEHLGECPQLSMIGFKSNRLTHVPASALPPQLRWLILTDNQLTALPPALGRCQGLEKLALAGNRLQHLPDEMAACQELGLLRISANQFKALPDWLTTLPRLAWLAYAGNPCAERPTTAAARATPTAWPDIAWSTLQVHALLGEGASGFIHAAHWQRMPDAPPEPAAIKLFKGAMTSDGLPDDELQACLAAGPHPHLIPVHGRLQGHPEGRPGLVMPHLDAGWQALAGPPSLSTCTRDVYHPGTRFDLDTLWRLACGIASATAHLHAQGILHGDLYGHNILWRDPGDALLGDFGAASFLPADPVRAQALQRLETRAYACLLEELLAHGERHDADDPRWAVLSHWQARCAQDEVQARPLMSDVSQALQAAWPQA